MTRAKIAAVLAALLIFSVVGAASMIIPADENAKENARAPDKSPAIDGIWGLERMEFVHYAKPVNHVKPAKEDSCYKLMKYKWTSTPVSYVINPGNDEGLGEGFVTGTLSASAETWDYATSSELFDNGFDVDYSARYGVQDFQNSIVFGDYEEDGVIAVTTIWYSRVGKRIVEFDMLFNTYWTWGDAEADSGLMDLQNIATHEFGHSVGLSDIYTASCSYVTMYGYSYPGDLEKRSLAQPDITGIQQIYGA